MINRPFPFVWVAACSALLCIAALELYLDYVPSVSDSALSSKRATSVAPYTPPERARFQEISARPVFAQTRRPSQTGKAVPTPNLVGQIPASSLSITLEGIVLSPEGNVALVRRQNSPDIVVVHENETIEGWVIEKITAETVTLRLGNQRREESLNHN